MTTKSLPAFALLVLFTAAACGDTAPSGDCRSICGENASGCVEEAGGTRCVCEIGYTGDRCDACEDGYALEDGSCVRQAVCGDGVVSSGEACDDDNLSVGDGCDGACVIEDGWRCTGEPSACELLPFCGDGTLDPGENCDDGNGGDGDGCSAICDVEAGWTCTGAPSTCTRLPACGDGHVDANETCDDDNTTSGDGCSDGCNVESGWTCTGQPSACTLDPVCGNGTIETGEVCDDGNPDEADGCDRFCAVEAGWTCAGEPSTCTVIPVCGNGAIETGEVCDDGNPDASDGCDAACAIETGWTCTGEPSTCTVIPVCGNGTIETGEGCDDGDLAAGDGCDALCAVESGWNCVGEPSVCEEPAACGDGVVDVTEQCDDGDLVGRDGCSAGCGIESGWSCEGEPSVCERIPASPAIQGETSAGHRDPTWLWSTPPGTFSFRTKLDTAAEQPAALTTTSYTASNLNDGAHTFSVRACNSQNACSAPGSFTTTVQLITVNSGYWNGLTKNLSDTPIGRPVAICRHNAYSDSGSTSAISLSSTKAIIDAAIAKNADLIELDVKENAGVLYVDHDETGTNGARLVDVLDYAPLQNDDAALYIELKESSTFSSTARLLLDLLNARRTYYARNGRPVFIRAFHAVRGNLSAVQAILGDYPLMKHYVRLHVLFSGNQTTDMSAYHQLIADADAQGLHGVEIPYTDENILSKILYARSLGLSATVWTIPASMGEAFISTLRNEVDAIVVEYDVALARQLVADNNQLVYMNVWDQSATGSSIRYHRTGTATYSAPINALNAPGTWNYGTGEDWFGTTLTFNYADAQSIPFWDADTTAGDGYLVTAYVNFDDLLTTCPGGGTSCVMSVLAKSESAGFALELYRSGTTRYLRFGVYVNGAYRYANYPLASLNGTNSYLVTGAYDGDGGVWMWIDNAHGVSAGATYTGGVTNNNVPVTLGADPQASGGPRYFLSAKVQMIQVLRWTNH